MPEHLRALVVILFLATVVFVLAKSPACALACKTQDFARRRNLWFAVTLVAFLAHNFWLYITICAALLLSAQRREGNRLAMFYMLLFALPMIPGAVSGFGVMDHFFIIHHVRLLALTVLLPAYLWLRSQADVEPFGRSLPDKFIAGYLGLTFFLMLRDASLTNSLRHGVFYAFIDVFLPYYVASRSMKNLQDFRDALMAFVVGAMVLAAVGIFEFGKHWLLYNSLPAALGMQMEVGDYLRRGASLRAFGTTGQPIPLGYAMAVAIGVFTYLKMSVPRSGWWQLGMILLAAGLVAPLSRGPWVGAVVIVIVFIAVGPFALRRMTTLAASGAVAFGVLLLSPKSQSIIDLLPFVGTVDNFNVAYRQRLLDISMDIVMQNPLLGSSDFLNSPMMQSLVQGQGIVDIVNTYIGVALTSGLVGLTLFGGIFVSVISGIFLALRGMVDRTQEEYVLGSALLATLIGILVIITTVSPISIIPVIYWSFTGLGVGYVRMVRMSHGSSTLKRAPFGTVSANLGAS